MWFKLSLTNDQWRRSGHKWAVIRDEFTDNGSWSSWGRGAMFPKYDTSHSCQYGIIVTPGTYLNITIPAQDHETGVGWCDDMTRVNLFLCRCWPQQNTREIWRGSVKDNVQLWMWKAFDCPLSQDFWVSGFMSHEDILKSPHPRPTHSSKCIH